MSDHNGERPPGHSNRSLLIVDDEHFIRQLLARIVQNQGFIVREAGNGREALAVLSRRKIDCVISDVRMPDMDGLQLLATIREEHPTLPVVMITAYAGDYDAEALLAAGADFVISKPFRASEISETLARIGRVHGTEPVAL